ncbi:polysaccharide pyruvyl transferase family protein [Muricauda sp. ANG21]|uniref:polysaccharide pyruvyl transferase family protein n=1 Tax=Allomuricauda sp. ANG21 TaxID=3042468 RepID=UPI003452D9EF
MKILLYGIWGVYNYGCEAIVRGTVNSFSKMYPGATIYYASFNIEDDARRLSGCNVSLVQRPFKNPLYKRAIRKLLSYMGVEYHIYVDSFDLIDNYDMVVSIGGDMYTISSSGEYPYSLMKFGDEVLARGKKYILWGCSIGPFEAKPKVLLLMKKHLTNVSLIVGREVSTIEYLKALGITENVIYAPDPAYKVAVENEKVMEEPVLGDIKVIGINLSPLSSLYFTRNIDEAISNQANTIISLIESFSCSVILLPHVLSNHEKDDDYGYLKGIYEIVNNKYPEKITIVNNDPGFIGLKETLKTCDVVIAARMHCAVNAITCKVPAIFLSYSKKSQGMANLVYGNSNFVMDLALFNNTKSVIEKIHEISKIDLLEFYKNVDQLKNESGLKSVKKRINWE